MKQKRLLNFFSLRGLLPLLAVFLCLIGGTGQVWADPTYDFTGKGQSWPAKPSSTGTVTAGPYYMYNIGQDAFFYVDASGNLKMTAGGQYDGATPIELQYYYKKSSYGSYWDTNTRGIKYIYNGTAKFLKLGATLTTENSLSTDINPQGNATGFYFYVYSSRKYYYIVGTAGGSLATSNTQANEKWLFISETDYLAALHSYYFAATAVNDASHPTAGSVYASFVNGAFTATSVTGSAGGNGSAKKTAYFKATRNPGYKFLGWYDAATAGNQKSADLTYAEEMTSTSDVEANPASIARYARYAATTVDAFDKVPEIDLSKPIAVDGVITINVSNAVDISDFNTPTLTNVSGSGQLTLGAATYADGVITIPMSFNPQGTRGETSATLTVSSKSGSTKSITVSALVRSEPTCDVEVRNSSDVVISDATTTFAQGIALANANPGSTILLLRNVDLGSQSASQTITKSTTLNLNGSTLSANMTSENGLLEINGTGIKVTITDRSVTHDGAIRNVSASKAYLYAVYVTKGTLTIEEGTIHAENTYGTASSEYRAIGIGTAVGTTLNVTGGIIEGVSAKDYANGIYSYGTTTIEDGIVRGIGYTTTRAMVIYDGVATQNGGELYAETTGDKDATGVYLSTKASVFNQHGGEIETLSKTTTSRGIYVHIAGSTVNIDGGSILATATTTTAYGVHDDTGGTINISGGTINANATTTTAKGIYMNHANTKVNVSNGSIVATANQTTSHGIHDDKGGEISVSGGIIHGIAKGLHLTAAGNVNGYGINLAYSTKTASFTGGTIIGESTRPSYGRYGYGLVSARKKTTIDGATIKGISAYQYGFAVQVSRDTVELKSGNIIAQSTTSDARGVYITASTSPYHGILNMTGGSIEVTSAETYAYGVFVNHARTYKGEPANITDKEELAEAFIKGGTILAKTEGESATTTAIGVVSYGNTTIEDGVTITANTKTTTAYGIDTRNGKTIVNGGLINASGTTTAYGARSTGEINSNYGYIFEGDLEVNGGTFNVTTTTGATAYGIYVVSTSRQNNSTNATYIPFNGYYAASAHALVAGGVFNVRAATTAAYGVAVSGVSITGTASAAPTCEVTGGKFKASGTGAVGAVAPFAAPENFQVSGGYYNVSAGLGSYATKTVYPLTEGAEYDEGYRFHLLDEREKGTPVCNVIVGSTTTPYYKLEAALAYVNNNPETTATIVLTNDYELPAGNYTLPAKATLLIPHKNGQTTCYGTDSGISNSLYVYGDANKATQSVYRKLTFKEGVHLDVYGKIEVSANAWIGASASTTRVASQYGLLELEDNSSISLQNGAYLFAWGYIKGKGTINAGRGSRTYELFQINDWKGGDNGMSMANDRGDNKKTYKVFIANQYAIQNIESAITFHPGAKEFTCAGVTAGSDMVVARQNDIQIFGTDGETALFIMNDADDSEDTWVRKSYDGEHDRQIYEVNSQAYLGSIRIQMKASVLIANIDIDMNSADYVLPITNNMTVRVLSGQLNITQSASLFPGAKFEVDKQATLVQDEGTNLFVYDLSEYTVDDVYGGYNGNGVAQPQNLIRPVSYSPSWGTKCPRTYNDLADAEINVHGTFDIYGGLYTTASGANIFSSNEDAGTINFRSAAPTTTKKLYSFVSTSNYPSRDCNPVWLKNGVADPAYTETRGAEEGKSYGYADDMWQSWDFEDCITIDNTSATPKYYAKPRDYVQITSNEENAETHLYYSTEGDRMFILMYDEDLDICQWWEVEATEDSHVFHCLHPQNNIYYYYDATAGSWKEKTIKVTWKNWDGTIIKDAKNQDCVYDVKFGTTPKFLSTNPKRAMTDYYTYDFIGWYPAITDETILYDDAVYIAQFEEKDRMYQITFKNDNGTTIETDYYAWNTLPECEKLPTKAGYILSWEPALGYVSGNQTYTAVWTSEDIDPATLTYTVTWKNFDGRVLQTDENVAWHATPVYTGENPTKSGIADKNFEWDGWLPEVAPVEGNVTYVAKFKEAPKKYTILFMPEVGDEPLQVSEYAYYEVPEFTGVLPTKEHANPTGYYYQLVWSPLVSAVVGNQDYHATFVERPNTMRLIVEGGLHGTVNVAVTGQAAQDNITRYSEILDYGTTATISATATDEHYHFVRWSDGVTTNERTVTVTGYAVYTAIYELNKYTITFANIDGNGATESKEYVYGSTPAYDGTPVKAENEDYTYTFAGWDKAFETVTEADTYTAQFDAHAKEKTVETMVVTTTVEVEANTTVNDLTIKETGAVTTTGDAQVTVVNNLFLEATPDNNLGAVLSGNIEVQGNAYIDINMNGSGTMNKGLYYSFAVPFPVNVYGGVFRMDGTTAKPINEGTGFIAYKYNEAERATKGKTDACWTPMKNGDVFQPGVFYLILFANSTSNTYRFQWNGDGSVNNYKNIAVTTTGNNATHSGWHGIANNGLGYTNMTGDFTIMQTLKSETNAFVSFTQTNPIAMANPVFVQMATGTINLSAPTTNVASAPRRVAPTEETELMNVRLTREGADKHDDQIFFSASEEAENQYTLGKDVAKMFMGTAKTAQLWINAYGERLVANEAVLNNDEARYPLSLYAPASGDYVINVNDNDNVNDNLYLLYEGAPVWNLSLSGYSIHLETGMTEGYELVLKRAPRVTTGMENVIDGKNAKAQKILFENKLFIINGEHVFDGQGKLIK